jgi:large subunit ribosomal protein L5
MNRFKEKQNEISKKLSDPKITKVIVNMGVGAMSKNEAGIEALRRDIAQITGQMPNIRKAKVSIASFSLREGQTVGISVTLRGVRMYSFLDRLFSIVLPRLRDFRGISDKAFDKAGNYTLGLSEHTIFPEIDTTKSAQPHGMEITIVNTAGSMEKAKELLLKLGCPFVKEEIK